uniref:Uncharacterized protein AlNc14C86G5487 n=1 Tax=Albugo laibachii Nc14 TaxID=890382 RepID=F0WFV2_9STRA|nr:conserved hypothetical protein [Albugo laibachii Nc14]|eukprot:CCA20086.1 conserved hypothetical protein [Albugo laibachii Nc14]
MYAVRSLVQHGGNPYRSLSVVMHRIKMVSAWECRVYAPTNHFAYRNAAYIRRSMSQSTHSAMPNVHDEIQATIQDAEAKAKQEQAYKKIQHMPIRAIHVARKMDLISLFQKLYTDRRQVSHYLHRDSIVLQLCGSTSHSASTLSNSQLEPETPNSSHVDPSACLAHSKGRRAQEKWIVYFDYGALVFFNCDPPLITTLTRHAKRFCTDTFDNRGHDEELLLISNPMLANWSELLENNILVQEIDHINIHVIAGVLAQTVALEHYERQIEAILTEFEDLNAAVERRQGPRRSSPFFLGNLLGSKQTEQQHYRQLFEIVATNNTLLIDLVSKLRVIDRKRPGDAEWSHTRYHQMWETLLEEFELNERFNNLNFKLELIQHNTKFFLEVLGTHKSERMEWYIIFLIAAELLVSIYGLIQGGH